MENEKQYDTYASFRGRGLNFKELNELLEYIRINHSWETMHERFEKGINNKLIKYVRFSVDTRTNEVWSIELDITHFRTEQGYKLKDKIYEWLNETEL